MKITNTNKDTYPTLTNTNILYTNIYDQFIDSLSFDKNDAIDAVHDQGYITEDEAAQLKKDGYAKRNAFTNIYIADTLDSITLYCLEHEDADSFSNINTLFKLSYFKINGFVVDELNNEEKLNMR